ncbi:unnamed protein product [Didymodactylos carnosus]|uniref:N-terminal methionine N(alpha)-acetyltransferase NatE n=1 Tax=Didymodactylos carnosus TaxID=1234261 RepID=A0A813WNQ2_9BILA|nr:unnamed protein product [Didymodactylos carnosus]CAF1020712.1 unnamed protein product [Didymodactylos carnosus]CAF3642742.1 unnamed protein product [Didymodactylos carnosus]CAF3789418.1 unnamed protein product [Didymodactylos carnosus]
MTSSLHLAAFFSMIYIKYDIFINGLESIYRKDVNKHHMFRIRYHGKGSEEQTQYWNDQFDFFLSESFQQTEQFKNSLELCPEVIAFTAPEIPRISAALMARYEELDDNYYICYLSVLLEYRKYGLASSLLNAMILEALDSGVEHVTLHVNIKNENALRLYKKCGFRCNKYESDYYIETEDLYSDGYYMILTTSHIRSPSLVCRKPKAVIIPPDIEATYTAQCTKNAEIKQHNFVELF